MTKILRKKVLQEGYSPQYFPTLQKLGRHLKGESMAEKVLREIEEYGGKSLESIKKFSPMELGKYEQHPDLHLANYLNNFHLRLRCFGDQRGDDILEENLHVPNRVRLKGKDMSGYSRVFLRQTPHEFYEAVDTAVRESGIDFKRLQQIQEKYLSSRGAITVEEKIERAKIILPVYIKLRECGYTKRELTG